MAPIIAGIIGLSLVIAFLGTIYLSEFHGSRLWLTRRSRLMDTAQEFGLKVVTEQKEAAGELAGLPFTLKVASVRSGKSKLVYLIGRLELPDCPPGLELREEDLLSGVAKTFGSDELSLGDPEFDAAFLVGGNSVEEVKGYLTPVNRAGLLRYLPELPHAHLKNGVVYSERRYMTPFAMPRHGREMVENFRQLAEALQSETPVSGGSTVNKKLRKFVGRSFWFWLLPCLLALSDPGGAGYGTTALLTMGTLLTGAAFTASEIARVMLQGFYAFLALSILVLIILGVVDGLELYNVPWLRLVDDDYVPFFFFTTMLGFLFWGIRNYLRTLDRSRVVVRDSETRPEL